MIYRERRFLFLHLVSTRSQAPAWERDCNKSTALNQKNEIHLGKKKQELLVQARSQAGAWEREKRDAERPNTAFPRWGVGTSWIGWHGQTPFDVPIRVNSCEFVSKAAKCLINCIGFHFI